MHDWTVYVKAAGDGDVSEDALDGFAGLLEDFAVVVSGGVGEYSAQFDVVGYDVWAAMDTGAHLFRERAAKAGLPDWPLVRVEVMTVEEQNVDLDRDPLPRLAGVAEAAELLGVSKQRVSTLARQHRDFPRPAMELASGPVWFEDAIRGFDERWSRKPGRPAAVAGEDDADYQLDA